MVMSSPSLTQNLFMNTKNKFWTIKNICQIALLTVILFVQEELLTVLPNIQLTFFLIILYSKVLGFRKTVTIVPIYLMLDCLVMGALNPIFVIFQLIGWMLIPILVCSVFKKIDNNIILAIISILFSLLYSWIMIIPNIIVLQVDFRAYLIADLPFEGLLAGSSFLSTLLLYNPLIFCLLFGNFSSQFQYKTS